MRKLLVGFLLACGLILAALASSVAGSGKDASPGAGTNTPLYFPQVFKDAVYCSDQLLENGGFEQGSACWNPSTTGDGPKSHVLIGSTAQGFSPHSGDYVARLGGYEGVYDQVEQAITIPANGGLSYWWKMHSHENLPNHDPCAVSLRTLTGAWIATLAAYTNSSPQDSWRRETIDLATYTGQTVLLRFDSYNDNYYFTTCHFDDILLSRR